MDRRGFVTSGLAAGMAGLATGGLSLRTLVDSTPELRHLGLDAMAGRSARTNADDAVRLCYNENPLGLAPGARDAVVDAIVDANRYPGDYATPLVEALAGYVGVAEENLVVGAGSTEILQMAVQAYQGPGVPLVLADPTYEDVPAYQTPLSFNLERVPLTADLAHDVGRMRDVAESVRRPVVVYVCNPNNPTGTLTPSDELDAWIADAPESTLFLMDEAYYEYVDDPRYHSALHWIDEKPNVIVARTFSKIFGMAGLRLGYGVAHPDTIGRLNEFVMQINPNVLAAAAGTASLADDELLARSVAVNDEAKAIAHEVLDELGLEHLPSHTNFLMHRIRGDLQQYIDRMLEAGIRVGRPFPPMTEWNRLSFGLPEEMDRWAETLRDFRRRGWV